MTEKELKIIKDKADKWDALQKKIESFYFNEDGSEKEEDGYDLADIGEVAALAFGML